MRVMELERGEGQKTRISLDESMPLLAVALELLLANGSLRFFVHF